jgi:hypothetical protein
MAGYSATPLWKKLGYTAGLEALVVNGPADYAKRLALPAEMNVVWRARAAPGMRFVHVFASEAAALEKQLAKLRKEIAPDGVVWVSWPKKASGARTDLTDNQIRAVALPMGYVDIKVCAVDETWSGLKLMIRRTERK